jgi:hypothetical protein
LCRADDCEARLFGEHCGDGFDVGHGLRFLF